MAKPKKTLSRAKKRIGKTPATTRKTTQTSKKISKQMPAKRRPVAVAKSTRATKVARKVNAPVTLAQTISRVEKEFLTAVKTLGSSYSDIRKGSLKGTQQLKKDLVKEQKTFAKLKTQRDKLKEKMASKKTPALVKQFKQTDTAYRASKTALQNVKQQEQQSKSDLKQLKIAEQKFQMLLRAIAQAEKTSVPTEKAEKKSKRPSAKAKSPVKAVRKATLKSTSKTSSRRGRPKKALETTPAFEEREFHSTLRSQTKAEEPIETSSFNAHDDEEYATWNSETETQENQ